MEILRCAIDTLAYLTSRLGSWAGPPTTCRPAPLFPNSAQISSPCFAHDVSLCRVWREALWYPPFRRFALVGQSMGSRKSALKKTRPDHPYHGWSLLWLCAMLYGVCVCRGRGRERVPHTHGHSLRSCLSSMRYNFQILLLTPISTTTPKSQKKQNARPPKFRLCGA